MEMTTNPDDDTRRAQSRLMQAYLLIGYGELQEAQSICEEVARDLPSHPLAPTLQGAIQIASGRPQEALKHLSKVLRRHPEAVLPRLYFCEACFLAGRVGRGLKELARLDEGILEESPWKDFAFALKEVWEGVDPSSIPEPLVVSFPEEEA